MMPTYLTLDQIAERLHTPRETVRYWVAVGKLRSYKPGRKRLVREDDLVAFIEGSTPPVIARPARKGRRAGK
jgi:excisionase family DNA binding protein